MTPRAITIRIELRRNRESQSQRKTRVIFKLLTLKRKSSTERVCSQRPCSSGWKMTSQEYEVRRDQYLRTSIPRPVGHLWVREVIQFRNQAKKKEVQQRTNQEIVDQAKWTSRTKTTEACWKAVTQQWQARRFSLQISCLNQDNRTKISKRLDRMPEDKTRNCTNSKAQAWIIWIQKQLREIFPRPSPLPTQQEQRFHRKRQRTLQAEPRKVSQNWVKRKEARRTPQRSNAKMDLITPCRLLINLGRTWLWIWLQTSNDQAAPKTQRGQTVAKMSKGKFLNFGLFKSKQLEWFRLQRVDLNKYLLLLFLIPIIFLHSYNSTSYLYIVPNDLMNNGTPETMKRTIESSRRNWRTKASTSNWLHLRCKMTKTKIWFHQNTLQRLSPIKILMNSRIKIQQIYNRHQDRSNLRLSMPQARVNLRRKMRTQRQKKTRKTMEWSKIPTPILPRSFE